MLEFSRDDLDAAFHDYAKRVEGLRKEAEDSVVTWTYADDWPHGLHPLFREAVMYTEPWTPKRLKWGPKESIATWHAQGVDSAGRIRIVENHWGQFKIYLYEDGFVDELFVRRQKLDSLQRTATEEGLVRALYDYRMSPHQTYVERFDYADGRCVRSVQQSEFVSDGEWQRSTWQTICEFRHDDRGLVSAYQDQPGLSGRKLVFLRPGPRSHAKRNERRPLVAYVVHSDPKEVEPGHSVYCDVYGLEMNYDDEWPLDVVPFVPAEHVRVVFDSTEVASAGSVYVGTISDADLTDFKAIAKTGAKWTPVEADHPEAFLQLQSAWATGLSVLLIAENAERLTSVLQGRRPPAPKRPLPGVGTLLKAIGKRKPPALERLAVALRTKLPLTPSDAQANANKVRTVLTAIGCADSRIVLSGSSLQAELGDYLQQSDIDGVFLEEGGFGAAVSAAHEIALRHAAG